ncbi:MULTISPECIES: plasmid replication protein RepC [unclassified Haematobacter]|uniref:plasmid replication protein RepC n=1 Tax=unclassified Haematobacter TaxID=2640585 RepID=UPI0025BE38D9|nr:MULTISPECIES: plasmid replication protein RepC [unclassified Haematobacter]
MTYNPLTSFRRLVSAAQMEQHKARTQPLPQSSMSKWDVLRELAEAKKTFGLTDRDLAILQALLSFYPGTALDDPTKLVVFPSNTSICERLNGMPCSTMRRHLANLVESGMILRRDSPNGKRYMRKGGAAFGFDLSPLLRRYSEICTAAQQLRDTKEQIASLKQSISLMRRDLYGLISFASEQGIVVDPDVEVTAKDCGNALRRKQTPQELTQLIVRLEEALQSLIDVLSVKSPSKTEEVSISDAHNEQHIHSSEKELSESETAHPALRRSDPDNVTLEQVLLACPSALSFSTHQVTSWEKLNQFASEMRSWLGIASGLWQHASKSMGVHMASVTLLCVLQRASNIRNPAAYFRSLLSRHAAGKFSPGSAIRIMLKQAESSQL